MVEELWCLEASARIAGKDEELSRLLIQFERDYISKDEFLTNLRRLVRPGPQVDESSILQEGGTDMFGEQSGQLSRHPPFAE